MSPDPAPQHADVQSLLAGARAAIGSGDHRVGLEQARQARRSCWQGAGRELAEALTLEGHHLVKDESL